MSSLASLRASLPGQVAAAVWRWRYARALRVAQVL
jgi:hypothetical protein